MRDEIYVKIGMSLVDTRDMKRLSERASKRAQ